MQEPFVLDEKARYKILQDIQKTKLQNVYRVVLIAWLVGIGLGAGFVLGMVWILRLMGA